MTEQEKKPAQKRALSSAGPGQRKARSQPSRPMAAAKATQPDRKPEPGQTQKDATRSTRAGSGRPARGKSQTDPLPTDKKDKKKGGEDKEQGGLHGIEALAALTVAEAKLSRFKGRVILGLTLVLVVSLGWNSVQSAFRPEPKLLALTQDGRVQPLPLLDEPIDSRQVLMDWVRRNIPELFSFNYVNYREELQNALDFTQPVTLERFRTDIEDAGILSKVTDEFLILRGNIVNEPAIINEMITNGRRIWVVEIPMNLIYDSGEVREGKRRRINQQILFTAWIARANVMKYDGGLMLAKYSIKTRRN